MKLLLSVAIILTLIGCEEVEQSQFVYVCPTSTIEKRADFIKSSIKNANNMSDEEMEDVISQLQKTANQLYCSGQLLTQTKIRQLNLIDSIRIVY
jgi:hypothetical protein